MKCKLKVPYNFLPYRLLSSRIIVSSLSMIMRFEMIDRRLRDKS